MMQIDKCDEDDVTLNITELEAMLGLDNVEETIVVAKQEDFLQKIEQQLEQILKTQPTVIQSETQSTIDYLRQQLEKANENISKLTDERAYLQEIQKNTQIQYRAEMEKLQKKTEQYQELLSQLQKQKKSLEQTFENIQLVHKSGSITRQEFLKETQSMQKQLDEKTEQIKKLQQQIAEHNFLQTQSWVSPQTKSALKKQLIQQQRQASEAMQNLKKAKQTKNLSKNIDTYTALVKWNVEKCRKLMQQIQSCH